MSSIWFLKLEMGPFWPGNEFRPDRLCSNSRWCGSPRARTRGGAISDAAGFPLVEPIRSLCRDGVRAADVPGEPARDRGVPANPTSGCLPHGHPWAGHPHGSGVRERSSRLAGVWRGGGGSEGAGEADLFARDATVIELSMALFPWARWQRTQASVKLNVLLDLRGDIPVFASLYEGNRHEVASLDEIPVYPGSYSVIDRGYLDFLRLHRMHESGAFFVTRLKSNTRYYVAESRPVDETKGLRCDQTIRLNSAKGRACYPEPIRRVSYVDPETEQALVFLTNQFDLDALIVAQIYRRRWSIETFFRWLKQHLRLRGFFSTSFNGVCVQIWTALCAYLLVAFAKQRKNLPQSLWEILQVISVSSLEQIPLHELLMNVDTRTGDVDIPNQLEIKYS